MISFGNTGKALAIAGGAVATAALLAACGDIGPDEHFGDPYASLDKDTQRSWDLIRTSSKVGVDALAGAYVDVYDADRDGRVSVTSEATRIAGDGVKMIGQRLVARADSFGDRDGFASRAEIAGTIGAVDRGKNWAKEADGNLDTGREQREYRALVSEHRDGATLAPGGEMLSVSDHVGTLVLGLFQRYDRDFDGTITRAAEAKAGSHDGTKLFQVADADSNGKVSRTELTAALRTVDTVYYDAWDNQPGPDERISQQPEIRAYQTRFGQP